jgi:hypothetical protein
MKRVVVLEEVASDLEEARMFYDRFEKGLGDYFLDALLADLSQLGEFHGIYYLDVEAEIRVIAILDLRREPSWIRGEIARRSGSA